MLLSLCCTACVSLGVSQLDSVIIAPPPLPEGETLTLAHLQPLWAELEKIVQSQKAASIGTSDLDKIQLEELYNWAQVRERICGGHNILIMPSVKPHVIMHWSTHIVALLSC